MSKKTKVSKVIEDAKICKNKSDANFQELIISSDDEEITKPKQSKKQPEIVPETAIPLIPHTKKEKKPYVLTPARKAQFEKARLVREDNIARKNAIRDEEAEKHELVKNELLRKKEIKSNKKKEREIKHLIVSESETESSSSEEAPVIIKKVKKPIKKTKKKVYVSCSEEESSDESVEVRPKHKPKKVNEHPAPKEVRRIIQFF